MKAASEAAIALVAAVARRQAEAFRFNATTVVPVLASYLEQDRGSNIPCALPDLFDAAEASPSGAGSRCDPL